MDSCLSSVNDSAGYDNNVAMPENPCEARSVSSHLELLQPEAPRPATAQRSHESRKRHASCLSQADPVEIVGGPNVPTRAYQLEMLDESLKQNTVVVVSARRTS